MSLVFSFLCRMKGLPSRGNFSQTKCGRVVVVVVFFS